MDFWRYILAVAQVAAAAQINFEEVKSAPMARFHRVGEVFPDALYGHIIVTFDVAELRGQMKDLQKVILYRQQRATLKHRDLYNVLEENLVAGNQELESNMTLGLGRPF
jgi:predicted nucleic acid-binding protein